MNITRTTLLGGPAVAIYAGHTFFARDGILVSPTLEVEPVGSDANGTLDETVLDTPVLIRFTPSAPAADLLALYPHLAAQPGESLFGSTDEPLVVIAANGVRLTFTAVAITQMPDLTLGARGPVAGTVTFLALGARTLGVLAANRIVTIDSAVMPEAPAGTPQLSDDYTMSWGAVPWLQMRSRDGIRVRLELKQQPVLSDANALLDLTLSELKITVRFTPESPGGPMEANVIAALQLQGVAPGRLLSSTEETLDIQGEGLSLHVPEAALIAAELDFAGTRPRLGELTFVGAQASAQTTEPLALLMAGRAA